MAQCTTTEIMNKFDELCIVDNSYKESILKDMATYYPIMGFAEKGLSTINDTLSIISKLVCSKISNRGDLCALTISLPELKERKDKLEEFDESVSYSHAKDMTYDIDELIEKLNFAREYGYPYLDNNGSIIERIYEQNNNDNCYLRGYYIQINQYSPKESESDNIYRSLDDLDAYLKFCANIQGLSKQYFNQLLNIDKEFDRFIIPLLSDENILPDELVKSAFIKLLETNPFIDLELIENYYDQDEVIDRGIRR